MGGLPLPWPSVRPRGAATTSSRRLAPTKFDCAASLIFQIEKRPLRGMSALQPGRWRWAAAIGTVTNATIILLTNYRADVVAKVILQPTNAGPPCAALAMHFVPRTPTRGQPTGRRLEAGILPTRRGAIGAAIKRDFPGNRSPWSFSSARFLRAVITQS
jgi:hypothetical protein